MRAEAWLAKAEKELKELRSQAALDGADAYRALVLSARLRGAAASLGPDHAAAVGQLALRCRIPNSGELLDALESACRAREAPEGPVLAGLLDLDDLTGVLALLGRDHESRDLGGRSAALASLFPEAVVELGEFAEMRLATLPRGAPESALWEAVADSPAELAASSLPRGATAAPLSERANLALERLRATANATQPLLLAALSGRSVAFRVLPSQVARAAAASPHGEETAVYDTEGRRVGVCAVDAGGGRSVIVRLPKGATAPKRVTAHAGGRSVELRFDRDGRDLHVSLAGAESLAAHGVIDVRLSDA